jgi:hypothetical protein
VVTALRSDYIGNRSWFQAVTGGKELVLCRVSALECLGLFVGYLNEEQIEVYAMKPGEYENINYRIVDSFDNLSIVSYNDVRSTCVNQTINDMLSDFDNVDEQALVEALATYYYLHNDSFDGLVVELENQDIFDSIKDWAIDYYNED